jgi:predicted ATPase
VIEEAKARSECTEERWPIAELLRIKGELLLLQAAPAAAARRQGALSWE